MTIPDNKSLVLEYSYKANGVTKNEHDVFNACTIQGVGNGGLVGNVVVDLEVKQASAQADVKGVMLYKVDANSDGIFLENARFNIYIWNKEQGKYIIVHQSDSSNAEFSTNASGMIVLDDSTMDQFAYNTAYYIVEVESPEGYYLSPEPYYFQIVNSDTEKYPACLPDGFNGNKLTSGDIIYRKNVTEYTEISVEKFWLDYDGNPITVTGDAVSSVTLELWQEIKDDPGSAKLFGTYTMTPDADGNWSLTIDKLPKATKEEDGTRGIDYRYYIKEVKVNGYSLESTENNNGIQSGVIKLVNRKEEGYVLPETGGSGTHVYTMAGSLMMLTGAAYLVYSKHFRRREEE
jgi:LPXTG-motif cell wall-anchored protein